MADERLALPREASIIAARLLRESPRSAAIWRSRRQNASSSEMLVRCPATTSERLMTRASPLSVAIGPSEPSGVELSLGKGALALDETLLCF